jgi:hypothetical protein
MFARRLYHSRDSEIVRGFRVVLVSTVVCGLSGIVLAALGEAVSSMLKIGSVECKTDGMVVCAVNDSTAICALNDGTVICALNDALFLFFCRLLVVDFVGMLGTVNVSAVAGDMI